MQLLPENGRGTSEVPMILSIIGFIATLPGILCAGCLGGCIEVFETASTGQSSGIGSTWMIINFLASAIGLYYGITSKSTPRTSGAALVVIAVVTLILSFVTLNWFWGLIAVACFSIGGAISLTQDKVNV